LKAGLRELLRQDGQDGQDVEDDRFGATEPGGARRIFLILSILPILFAVPQFP
jgi:hypothetical protein